MEKTIKKSDLIKILGLIIATFIIVPIVNGDLPFFKGLDPYKMRITNLSFIYIILALSMNLINGYTGLFSLGHAGFMAVGAYTVAILTMPYDMKIMNFYMKPMNPLLLNLELPFIISIFAGGIVAAIFGFLIGFPVLRLTDDYLAIASLGFAEIIRVVFTVTTTITNGALGLKGIPPKTNLYSTTGFALITLIFLIFFITSSYGKAIKAIRDDEIAARSMGVNLFSHKLLSFTIGSFFAGIGGGLMAGLLGTIDPLQFQFALTFNILLMVVLGGMGNMFGIVISSIIVTFAMEYMRFLDEPINLFFIQMPAKPGLRMVVFSLLLILIIIFKRKESKEKFQRLFRREKNA